jgi:hypothetical protein
MSNTLLFDIRIKSVNQFFQYNILLHTSQLYISAIGAVPKPIMLTGKTTLIALVAAFLSSSTNAAVLNLFSDRNCKTPAGNRNVWDNTCAPVGGFQSYMIVTAGGIDQAVTTYSRNACAGDQTTCNSASSLNICYPAFNSQGGSNAIGSGPACGII